MDAKKIQRLTVVLKSGNVLSVDFGVAEEPKLNPQIELLAKSLGDSKAQNNVIIFEGQRLIGIRISEVSAFEVIPLVVTPKEAAKAEEKTEPKKKGEKA